MTPASPTYVGPLLFASLLLLALAALSGGCQGPYDPRRPIAVLASPEAASTLDVVKVAEGLAFWDEAGAEIRLAGAAPSGAQVLRLLRAPLPAGIAGDFDVDSIVVSTGFVTDDPRDVVAHEAGHALGLGHVFASEAVMYPGEHRTDGLSPDDLDEFGRVWGR